ncbi:polysialyltransferase family glycosyltransferase [Neobacillus drentensis]|uniref:polysialyltransferase family glycosyltransferase n=1 Tax=Neobacillus drentensis TaxID=220684 RepID=UPI002FFFA47B
MNLFIISGVSHLYHVQNIIKNYNYFDNRLIILELPHTGETEKNLLNLRKQIISEFFQGISVIKLSDLSREYFKLVEEFGVFSNLFMTAYTGVFYDIAKHAKENRTKLILFEEGLSTYKLVFIKNQGVLEKIVSFLLRRKVPNKRITKQKSKGNQNVNNELILKLLLRKYFYILKSTLYKVKRKLEYRFFTGYDYAYVTYPDKLSPLMKVKNYEKNYRLDFPLKPYVEETLETIVSTIPDNSLLFMSQPMYHTSLTEEEYVDIVYQTLNGFSEETVLIKLHPRETDKKRKLYNEKLSNLSKNVHFIEGEEGMQIPSELLLRNDKVRKIVAFSSTTMIYTPLINKNIESISIFNQINKRNIEKKGAKFIMKEIKKELEKFDHIKFLK